MLTRYSIHWDSDCQSTPLCCGWCHVMWKLDSTVVKLSLDIPYLSICSDDENSIDIWSLVNYTDKRCHNTHWIEVILSTVVFWSLAIVYHIDHHSCTIPHTH